MGGEDVFAVVGVLILIVSSSINYQLVASVATMLVVVGDSTSVVVYDVSTSHLLRLGKNNHLEGGEEG